MGATARVKPVLVDAYGRPLKDLRLSVTPECNLDCFFCHMEGLTSRGPLRPGTYLKMGGELLTPGDYEVIAEAGRRLGIASYKITGGEPLVRPDIVEVIEALARSRGEISMTTNGTLLEAYAFKLADAGLKRVNVSIHGLQLKTYTAIMGRPLLERALKGVKAALEAGLGVKINFVLVRGLNEADFWRMLEMAEDMGIDLQVIELHPAGRGAKVVGSYRSPLEEIKSKLEALAVRVERGRLHNRPVYVLPSGVKVFIVEPTGNPIFCQGCERLRISWNGELLPCLYWKGGKPSLLPALRSSVGFEEKVRMVAAILAEANTLRRPTAYYSPSNSPRASTPRGSLRLGHPSKARTLRIAMKAVNGA
ncbi:MAG: GTP 3',8-cyclase MoaA [Desulfurococcales archaeon]|nr:GTP 3',8-cyclase MoaA [Desulfurococcales archaeon]